MDGSTLIKKTLRWFKERSLQSRAKAACADFDELIGETTKANAEDFTSKLDETTISTWPYLLHRTSPESAQKIIIEKRMYGPLGWVCFSVAPNQFYQAERRGAILFFRWTGAALVQQSAVPGCLVHNFSPQYVESRIAHGEIKGRLELIGIMHPDDFEQTRNTIIRLLQTPIPIRIGL